jgi:hypothetical protein
MLALKTLAVKVGRVKRVFNRRICGQRINKFSGGDAGIIRQQQADADRAQSAHQQDEAPQRP